MQLEIFFLCGYLIHSLIYCKLYTKKHVRKWDIWFSPFSALLFHIHGMLSHFCSTHPHKNWHRPSYLDSATWNRVFLDISFIALYIVSYIPKNMAENGIFVCYRGYKNSWCMIEGHSQNLAYRQFTDYICQHWKKKLLWHYPILLTSLWRFCQLFIRPRPFLGSKHKNQPTS